MFKSSEFTIRTATLNDLPQLIELEKEWPEDARASSQQLEARIKRFPEGYFVGEDETGLVGSLITHPYWYQANNLSNYQNWDHVVNHCYNNHNDQTTNALYIVAGTTKKTRHGAMLFNSGIQRAIELAKSLGKEYIVGGALLPGFAHYLESHPQSNAEEYVFKQVKGKLLDPLIEKYRRIGFVVPDKSHILADYFPHTGSKNYSALVVKKI